MKLIDKTEETVAMEDGEEDDLIVRRSLRTMG